MSEYNTNPGGEAATNVGDGPRVGNKSYGGKRGEFIAQKESFQRTATEITERYGQRGDRARGHIEPDDDSIKPNVKMKRGPTRGNG